MRFCFIIEEEYRREGMPLRVAEHLASCGHDVRLLEPQASATCLSALARVGHDRFDAYVLKTASDGPGICILEAAAASGVATINNPRAIRLVRDKATGAARARAANIPFPLTYFVVDPRHVELIPRGHYPLVIKPNNGSSTRNVHRIDHPAQVDDLGFDSRRDRFFLAQPYVENEGFDVKLYVVGREVFGVMRGSPLHPHNGVVVRSIEPTAALKRIAMHVRRVFGLDIFGVDLVRSAKGWVAVDINDFPGFGGVPDAAGVLSTRIERIARHAAVRRAIGMERRPLFRRPGAGRLSSWPSAHHDASAAGPALTVGTRRGAP